MSPKETSKLRLSLTLNRKPLPPLRLNQISRHMHMRRIRENLRNSSDICILRDEDCCEERSEEPRTKSEERSDKLV